MNKQKIMTLLAFILLSGYVSAQTGSIKIEIQGIVGTNGEIQIGLYNSADDFPDFEKSFKGGFAEAGNSGALYKFEDIPIGKYAIAIWHDENSDKVLNKNFFGVPKEKYGFSNNVFGSFGPPDFEDASFSVVEGETAVLKIKLK